MFGGYSVTSASVVFLSAWGAFQVSQQKKLLGSGLLGGSVPGLTIWIATSN